METESTAGAKDRNVGAARMPRSENLCVAVTGSVTACLAIPLCETKIVSVEEWVLTTAGLNEAIVIVPLKQSSEG